MDAALPSRLEAQRRDSPLKVLIVRTGALGDILHALPAVAALRERLPDARIGWAVEPRYADLLHVCTGSGKPVVDQVHPVPTREWKNKPFSVGTLRQIAVLRRELRNEQYNVAVDLQGSIRSAVIGRMAEAKRFIGPAQPRERQARALYRERVATRAEHVIDQASELLASALPAPGGHLELLSPAELHRPTVAACAAWCSRRLAELGVSANGFVLLCPTAGWGAKQWPIDGYRELARRLGAEGYTILINAGTGLDRAVAAAVALPGHGHLVESSLAELIELTGRARLVVGGDTGPVHLAASQARPVVALFGPTDPERTGPYFPGSGVRVLRHPLSRSDHARRAATEAGLALITADEVFRAAHSLLQKGKLEEGKADG